MQAFAEKQRSLQSPLSGRIAKIPPSPPIPHDLQLSIHLLPHTFSSIPLHPPLPGPLQAKLTGSKANDEYEREADHLATHVTQMPDSQSKLQRACACGDTCPKCRKQKSGEEENLQTKRVRPDHEFPSEVPSSVHDALSSPGHPLPASARSFMEPRFGYDFSRVSVYSNPAAAQSARDVGAHAYAVGNNIVFAEGQYSPETSEGRWLLAHELAHVVQQSAADPVSSEGLSSASPIHATPSATVLRRHATSDCDSSQAGLVASAVKIAQDNITAVLPQLAANPLTPDMENALWIYFRDSSAATAATVSSNLTRVSAKIGSLTYECESDCDANELGYTKFGTVVTGLGHIHLCMSNLENDADKIANTIIHEATHYTISANDSAGYYGNDCSESETTVAAGSSTKLDLADSYNCFVKNWLTAKASDRADTKGDLTGANIEGIIQSPAGTIDLDAPKKKPLFSMKLKRGPVAIITGVSYRWIFRDEQDRSYKMTDTSGNELFESKPSLESVLAIFNTPTRTLLKERGIKSGRVICRATSPVFNDKLFEIPVTFV